MKTIGVSKLTHLYAQPRIKQSIRFQSIREFSTVPLYEYRCTKCGHTFEKIQKFSDPHVSECPKCGAAVEQIISAPAVQFKGAGWYVTDYGKRTSSNGGKKDVSSSSETTSETKSEGKTESTGKPDNK
jgi:putative FmdB family regulatory protein